jgi:hypothetical protein
MPLGQTHNHFFVFVSIAKNLDSVILRMFEKALNEAMQASIEKEIVGVVWQETEARPELVVVLPGNSRAEANRLANLECLAEHPTSY